MTGIGRLAATGVAAALLVGVAGTVDWQDSPVPATADAAATSVEPRLVLVSGRDDHGMVVMDHVPLYDAPGSAEQVATVHDGTLAEVLSTDGRWLQVRAVEGRDAIGWVDDFYLRGEVRLVGAPPTCETTVDGRARAGGTLVVVRDLRAGRVRVETVTPPVVHGFAPRADVQELPPQGARCGDIPPDDAHAHDH